VWKGREGIDAHYRTYVRDEKGNLAPETERGRQLAAGNVFFMGSASTVTLQPGDSQTDEITLNKLYVLDPGKYTVQVEPCCTAPGVAPVRSNTITVTVTK